MYAIVDIETTGGSAAQSAITEIAVLLHNGQQIESRFHTLLNPEIPIPYYITALTGINDSMVRHAPPFKSIAPQLFALLKDRIFVAHNVNFDHSFLHYQFKMLDLDWQTKKLCTVRYARKVVPGLPSYSLGNLCRSLNIGIENRHRALGDVTATARLFEYLLQQDSDQKFLSSFLKGRNPNSYLPMHVPAEMVEALPYAPGVYYFKNKLDKIVYVGKAVNLKYRVRSHFTNNAAGKRRQEMLREIYSIDYQQCATELMALVKEALEIKRLWPAFNRSQKRFDHIYGLYRIEDRVGRIKLVVDKIKKVMPAICTFSNTSDGYALVRRQAVLFDLKPEWVLGHFSEEEQLPDDLNSRIEQLAATIKQHLPDFALIETGKDTVGKELYAVYLVQSGRVSGIAECAYKPATIDEVKAIAEACPFNAYISQLVFAASFRSDVTMLIPPASNPIPNQPMPA